MSARGNVVPLRPVTTAVAVAGTVATASMPLPVSFGDLNDMGNARRFVARHGAGVKYDSANGRWLAWDGRRWTGAGGGVLELAKETVSALYKEAETQAAAVLAHARKSGDERRLRAMLKLAATDPAVAVTPAALDQDPFLFNVENGTIDLRTGKLRPHERHDLLTKLAPVVYHPGAKSTLWMDFLRSAVPSPRRRAYLQQVCGYLLTGVTSEDKVFILHGPGGTGKTTFTEAFKAVLGDYAMATPVATLAKATTGKVRNDLARLTGARMVTASESERFEVVAEALLKLLSGGDTITARFMFKEFFEFLPQFKLVIVTNDFPRLSCDSGVRRRVVRIGFDRPVPARERDAELKRKLRDDPEERAAILAWAVEGCLAWQEKKRLHEPWSIRTGTRLFRPDSYDVAPFVTERCMLNRAAVEPVANLFAAYEVWAAKERRPTPARGRKYRPLGRNDFKAALEAAGLEQRKVNKGSTVRVWRGVRLR